MLNRLSAGASVASVVGAAVCALFTVSASATVLFTVIGSLRILRDEDAVGAAVAIESAETAAWLPQATQNNSSAATITAHKKRFNGAKPPFCIK